MTELSGFWTTEASSPAGDQVAGYTQAHWSTALAILAACSGYIGIAPGYRSTLTPSVGGANTVNIAAGGGVADGKWYDNNATVAVNIPSAVGGGNTRIDRIVLRVGWAGFTARITRIAGIDASSPTAPAITTTSGTTYDIMICQATVNTSGVVSISLDERQWAMVPVDDTTIVNSNGILNVPAAGIDTLYIADGAVETAKIDDDAVDDTKVGDRVPQFYRRQGGSASDWSSPGTTTRTPGAVRMQAGVVTIGSIAGGSNDDVSVTFPEAFDNAPIVLCSANGDVTTATSAAASTGTISSTGFNARIYNLAAGSDTFRLHWLAIGPE